MSKYSNISVSESIFRTTVPLLVLSFFGLMLYIMYLPFKLVHFLTNHTYFSIVGGPLANHSSSNGNIQVEITGTG
jgi:hypothetical protein